MLFTLYKCAVHVQFPSIAQHLQFFETLLNTFSNKFHRKSQSVSAHRRCPGPHRHQNSNAFDSISKLEHRMHTLPDAVAFLSAYLCVCAPQNSTYLVKLQE